MIIERKLVEGKLSAKIEALTSVNVFQVNEVDPATEKKEDIEASLNAKAGKLLEDKYLPGLRANLSERVNQDNQQFEGYTILIYSYKNTSEIITVNSSLTNYSMQTGKPNQLVMWRNYSIEDSKYSPKTINVPKAQFPGYGEDQLIMSSSLFNNSLAYAVQSQYVYTVLEKTNWNVTYFDYLVGDLIYIIPGVKKDKALDEELTGRCFVKDPIKAFEVRDGEKKLSET